MKKFFLAVLTVVLMAGCAWAADDVLRIGNLTKLNITPEEYQRAANSALSEGLTQEFRKQAVQKERSFKFYDSLMTMLLALNKGEIDEMSLPKDVADYVLKNATSLEIGAIARLSINIGLAFGFDNNEKGHKLKTLFNTALAALENSGRLAHLRELYITNPKGAPVPAQFTKFEGAETIKVAVTGDLPPIDFIAENGIPAGFNTAVLAEVAKITKVNIELVNIDSSVRASALKSGRVDMVFWFEKPQGGIYPSLDIPEGIILSEPYYTFNEYMNLKKK